MRNFCKIIIGLVIVICVMAIPVKIQNAAEQIIHFPDKTLEAAIREKINKPQGEIYKSDLEEIYTLDVFDPVSTLEGLQYATNLYKLDMRWAGLKDITVLGSVYGLEDLMLWRNNIKDISPLRNLKNLRYLDLGDNHEITDLSPLSDLNQLEKLSLYEDNTNDIEPLKNLTNLRILDLGGCKIKDISVLDNLRQLEELNLDDNKIKDITPLKNLLNLKKLGLNGNDDITDYTPTRYFYNNLEKRDFKIDSPRTKDEIIIVFNDEILDLEQKPVIENGRTLVPFRKILETMGANVEYDNSTKTITVTQNGFTIKLQIDSKEAWINGQKEELEIAPKIIGNRTLVPTRFLAEKLGLKVSWDKDKRIISIIDVSGKKISAVYINNVSLIGGSIDGKWTNVYEIAKVLKKGDKYNIYSLTEKLGASIGEEPILEETPVNDIYTIDMTFANKITSYDQEIPLIKSDWDAMPRKPKIQPNDNEEYKKVIKDRMVKNNVTNSEIVIQKVINVDLDNDKKDEIILVAGDTEVIEADKENIEGVCSIILIGKESNENIEWIPVEENYEELWTNKVIGILDINGDGKMELIVHSSYYEDNVIDIYEFDNKEVKLVVEY